MEVLAKFKMMLEDTCPNVFDPAPNNRIPGDPWRSYKFTCDKCQGSWLENQRIGTKGIICPHCGESDIEYVWD